MTYYEILKKLCEYTEFALQKKVEVKEFIANVDNLNRVVLAIYINNKLVYREQYAVKNIREVDEAKEIIAKLMINEIFTAGLNTFNVLANNLI